MQKWEICSKVIGGAQRCASGARNEGIPLKEGLLWMNFEKCLGKVVLLINLKFLLKQWAVEACTI